MSWPVEPEIDATTPPKSDSVREALTEVAGRTVGGQAKLVVLCGLAAVVALALSLWDVGARAPVDLPILCVAIAFVIGGIMASLAKRRTAAFLARVTAQDLIGFTPNLDKSLWLHFRNGRTLRTPQLNFDLALIEAALAKRPAPPKIRPGALLAWAAFLAPLGVGLWLNDVPIPAKISQIDSTRGTVELRGTAKLSETALLQIGKSAPYATMIIDDGSGKREILVEVDAIPDDVVERARQDPGIALRVVAHHKKTRFKGVGTAEIDVLIADWFEPLGSDQKPGR